MAYTAKQKTAIDNMLRNGGGVTRAEIAAAVGIENGPELGAYLMDLIVAGPIVRRWNGNLGAHYYLYPPPARQRRKADRDAEAEGGKPA